MNLQVVEFLNSHPGYLKKGASVLVPILEKKNINTTVDEIKKAQRNIRKRPKVKVKKIIPAPDIRTMWELPKEVKKEETVQEKIDDLRDRLEAAFAKLIFEEEGHKYTIRGKKIPSTSAKLKNFYPEFNSNIAFYVAGKGKYKGQSGIEILLRWEEKARVAAEFGTKVHKFGEEYPIRPIKPSNNAELGIVQWWMDMPEHIHFVIPELTMYSDVYKFGGTADIILYNEKDDSIIIADYKTNADLFKSYNKMYEPFADMENNSFNKYQLQFSHYQMCLEEKGFNVSRRLLIHLTFDEETGKYYKNYNTEDFTSQIKDHYGNNTTAY